jgi:hypothetical protein
MYVTMPMMTPLVVALCLGITGLTGCSEEGGKQIALNAEGRWRPKKD